MESRLIPIHVPDIGEGGTLSIWYVEVSEAVYEGDRLVELLLDRGATFDVSAPSTGCLVEKVVRPDDPLHVGQILGYIEPEES